MLLRSLSGGSICVKTLVKEDLMKNKRSSSKKNISLRVYGPPKVVVYGDVKKITLNSSTPGSGDAYGEAGCTSAGCS